MTSTFDSSNLYVHSIFTLLLIKQIFEIIRGQHLKAETSFGLELALQKLWSRKEHKNKEHKTKERKHKNKNIKSTYKTNKETKISVDLSGKYKKDTNSQGYQYQDNINLGQYHLVSEI